MRSKEPRYPVLDAYAGASSVLAPIVGALSLVGAWATYGVLRADDPAMALVLALSLGASGLVMAAVIAAAGDIIRWMHDVASYQFEQRALLRRLTQEGDRTTTTH